jgi:O-antigen/teichoic acid export membrane protein
MTLINKILKQSIIGMLCKSISIIVLFSATPYLINSLGIEGYGVWAAYYSMVGWGVLVDFGIGSVLINKLSNSQRQKERYILSAIIVYSVIILLLLAFIFFAFNYYSLSIMIMILFIGLSPLLAIVEKIYIAEAKSHVVDFIQLIISITFLSIFYSSGYSTVTSILIIYVVTSILLRMFFLIFFINKFSNKVFCYNRLRKTVFVLLYRGKDFFFLQVGAIFLMSIERIVILNIYGEEVAASYDLVVKCFLILLVFSNIFSRGVWGTVSSIKKGDSNLNDLFLFLNKLCLYSFLLFFLLSIVTPYFIYWWVGINISFAFSVAVAFWSYLQSVFVLICNLMNGLNLQKTQKPFYIFSILIKLIVVLVVYKFSLPVNIYILLSGSLLIPYIAYVYRYSNKK